MCPSCDFSSHICLLNSVSLFCNCQTYTTLLLLFFLIPLVLWLQLRHLTSACRRFGFSPPARFSPGTVGCFVLPCCSLCFTEKCNFWASLWVNGRVKKRPCVRQHKAPVQPLETEGKEADFLKTRHLVSRQAISWSTLCDLTQTVQQITAQKGFTVWNNCA